ncbi:MAG TPA: glycosyltransferase family 4 protein [Pseudobdellovibrionaceae bacterium]|nr:glycosyltransferase family 4 protein [Pseudobdellovibrionaceae bacterium]
MRILIVTQYFYPENFRINDVATELVQRGHEVHVLTNWADYPHPDPWIGSAYRKSGFSNWSGVEVQRVPIFSRGRGGWARRIANYLSFIASACLHFRASESKRPDVIYVWASSPITVALPALWIAKRYNVPPPVAIWVQDLWPETLQGLGSSWLGSNFVQSLMGCVVRYIYQRAQRLHLQSEGFIDSVKKWGAHDENLMTLPNWFVREVSNSPDSGAPAKPIPRPATILYAGNLGHAQGLDAVVELIDECAQKSLPVRWMFVGDGSCRADFQLKLQSLGRSSQVEFRDRVPPQEAAELEAKADFLFLSLVDADAFNRTLPSKFVGYLSAGRPILALAHGITATYVQRYQLGLCRRPKESRQLANDLELLLSRGDEEQRTFGENARALALREFKKSMILDKLEMDLLRLSQGERHHRGGS